MCKVGDILLILNVKNKGKLVGRHPFLVLDDTEGKVSGVYDYDFIGLLLTSADTEEKKKRLGNIVGNFPIAKEDKILDKESMNDTNRNSYVEADQFFYFDKNQIKYIHIGRIEPDIYNLITEFIEEISSDGELRIKTIVDKATKIDLEIDEESA